MTSPSSAEPHREYLSLDAEPVDVLRRFRGRERLVALIGAWHHGEALIAFEPQRLLDDLADIDLPRIDADGFGGGWIGALGYRLGRRFETLGPEPQRPFPQPDLRMGYYDIVLRCSNKRWSLESLGPLDPNRRADILAALQVDAPPRNHRVGAFAMTPEPEAHIAGVKKVLDHIWAGDIFQANLCLRLEAEVHGDPLDVFCAGIEALAPAYGAFVSGPEGCLVSFSPELFLRRRDDSVLSSPIKGTAALTEDPQELVSSAKNRAENIMIVDLMRNDLGRIAVPGSVRVPAMTRLEKHSVWHLVSDVVANMRHGVSDAELLRATFPPGSVTGAPKVRAMQIIAATEATAREAYTGAIGHVSPVAGTELNVVIRTFEFVPTADGTWRAWLGVGGGIVADSDPVAELGECLVKARPLIEAIGGTLALDVTIPEPQRRTEIRPETTPPHADPALGVFETMLVEDGRVHDLHAHLARLDASTRAVYGRTVRAGLAEAIAAKTASLSGRHVLRVTARPHLGDVKVELEVSPVPPAPSSWHLVPRVLPGGQGAHKWVDRRLLETRGDKEPLLIDSDGSLLETARATLFLVLDDGLHTPALDGRILPGTVRSRVIERAGELGIGVHQHRLTTADLARASEVFVTNSLRDVVPVTACDGVGSWPIGPLHSVFRRDADSRPVLGPRPQARTQPTVVFIDNYDSFVFNLAQYAGELGAVTHVIRNDAASITELHELIHTRGVTHLVISPGPGTPRDAGVSAEVITTFGTQVPILGVCLGHQVIAEVFGGRVVRASSPVHGKASLVHHHGESVFAGLPSPLVCGRYHSLIVDDPGPDLQVTARTADGTIMGLQHRTLPIHGVQIHPESILTRGGHEMMSTFLALAHPPANRESAEPHDLG